MAKKKLHTPNTPEIWIGPGWAVEEDHKPGEVIHRTRKGKGEVGRLIGRKKGKK